MRGTRLADSNGLARYGLFVGLRVDCYGHRRAEADDDKDNVSWSDNRHRAATPTQRDATPRQPSKVLSNNIYL
jgi:hypothetical protein